MDLSPRLSEALSWAFVVGLAFYAAEASCATAECRLTSPPAPLLAPSPEFREMAKSFPVKMEALLSSSRQELVAAGEEASDSETSGLSFSKVEFVLTGTLADDKGRGLALLSLGGKTPEPVSTGQEIGGWTLEKVAHQWAELRRDGVKQNLDFLVPLALDVPREDAPVELAAAQPSSLSTGVEPIRTQSELRDLLSGKDPQAQAGGSLKPFNRDGEIQGYLVRVKDPRFPLARIGLLDRDVVTSVNGVPCTGAERLSEIYRILRNDLTIRIELLRGGEPTSLVVNLEE